MREPWEKNPWEYPQSGVWADGVMTHGYPESGPGSIDVDTLYQAFKERFMAELAAVKPAGTAVYVDGVEVRYLPLVDKEQL